MEEIKQYLTSIDITIMNHYKSYSSKKDWKYASYQRLILDHAKPMIACELPRHIDYGFPKSCYYNSFMLASTYKELVYVEGYAIPPEFNFPVQHAWLMTCDGHAIDPTWEPHGSCYFGVPFNTAWVIDLISKREKEYNLSIFDGNYLEDFSLLKNGIPQEALQL